MKQCLATALRRIADLLDPPAMAPVVAPLPGLEDVVAEARAKQLLQTLETWAEIIKGNSTMRQTSPHRGH